MPFLLIILSVGGLILIGMYKPEDFTLISWTKLIGSALLGAAILAGALWGIFHDRSVISSVTRTAYSSEEELNNLPPSDGGNYVLNLDNAGTLIWFPTVTSSGQIILLLNAVPVSTGTTTPAFEEQCIGIDTTKYQQFTFNAEGQSQQSVETGGRTFEITLAGQKQITPPEHQALGYSPIEFDFLISEN